MSERDVVITGIGLVSCLGEGIEVHRQALLSGSATPVVDETRFAPFAIHPLPALDWNLQIPKRGDQRQMELWQRLGTYAAGLALDDAGVKGDEALCATMDMIVAAAGGERDEAVDVSILDAAMQRNDAGVLINERLTTDLRPTLFLAQLSNLLAGNISIVHKVTGSSRTFMGEEGSGVAAVATAADRIRAGQSTHALVGAALQVENPDVLLSYELGGYLQKGAWSPVWQRGDGSGGVIPGSGAAFLVLESRAHAEARGARIHAVLGPIASGRARRSSDDLADAIRNLAASVEAKPGSLVISGASGGHAATAAERTALAESHALRGFSSLTGHLKEAQFPFAVALAALAVSADETIPPMDTASERPGDGPVTEALATAIGYHRYEGVGRVSRA